MSSVLRLVVLAVPFALGCTSSRGDVFVGRQPTPALAHCAASIYCTGLETPTEGLEAIGTGSVEVVSSPVHAGASALRVSTAAADDWASLTVPLAGLSQVGVRFWVMLDVGARDVEIADPYVLAALHPLPALGRNGINKVSVDLEADYQLKLVETLTPNTRHSDSPLTPGQWHCIQLEVRGEAGSEQASFSLDGSLRATTNAAPSVVSPGGFQSLLVGIEYAEGPAPLVLYYDDITVDEAVAPCSE